MDITTFSFVLGQVFVVLGALVFATAALGLVRFTDPFMRVSAVGTAGGLGMILVVVGCLLVQPTVVDTLKVILIIFMQLGTSAIGTMAIARSSYLTGVRMDPGYFDELDEDDVTGESVETR
ncbi:cation:proton antiporter [Auritidibacter ignavus]|uniref:cation:proton antiporter n=1 Tax=Auritidibacter ignavus TaxID=678932 RepID=UPI000F041B25|nr:monovalent cation/H(+) antiporter subunit G [Auritidibacter ignavus]NIH70718.1 multicomponent Na+:H+ antiporter subunit G [Auritidibacter ignavus]RMX23028.1 monovalent cation/H(+) antiporter subunit G [Auritidibacter ignavus]